MPNSTFFPKGAKNDHCAADCQSENFKVQTFNVQCSNSIRQYQRKGGS